MLDIEPDPVAIVKKIRPTIPTYLMDYTVIKNKSVEFINTFNGNVVYAVKVNPSLEVLQTIYDSGINHFDVASLNEVKLIHENFPDAELFFMHPVKAREDIAESHEMGVRTFAFDTEKEYKKIKETIVDLSDITLFLRVQLPDIDTNAAIPLTKKFGAILNESIELFKIVKNEVNKIGITFHVGSQCMNPYSYQDSMKYCINVLKEHNLEIDYMDIGGGFPSVYPDMKPESLQYYMNIINNVITDSSIKLFAEPGRALVSDSGNLVVKVILRKDNVLYLNDGTYGGLFDAGKSVNFTFDCIAVRTDGKLSDDLDGFRFAGPTCDSLDMMDGPFYLPKDIDEGDYIIIKQMGAYSECLRTNFNGYKDYQKIDIYKQ
jgi:ornithine decarboxylase